MRSGFWSLIGSLILSACTSTPANEPPASRTQEQTPASLPPPLPLSAFALSAPLPVTGCEQLFVVLGPNNSLLVVAPAVLDAVLHHVIANPKTTSYPIAQAPGETVRFGLDRYPLYTVVLNEDWSTDLKAINDRTDLAVVVTALASKKKFCDLVPDPAYLRMLRNDRSVPPVFGSRRRLSLGPLLLRDVVACAYAGGQRPVESLGKAYPEVFDYDDTPEPVAFRIWNKTETTLTFSYLLNDPTSPRNIPLATSVRSQATKVVQAREEDIWSIDDSDMSGVHNGEFVLQQANNNEDFATLFLTRYVGF